MNCGIMSPVSILQCLLLLLASLLVYGQLSDLRRCADPQCQKLISKAHTIMKYPSGTTGVLSFPNNAEVNVYSKEAGSNPDWWGVEINGKFGYAPKKFIREDKVLLKDDLLTHIVPVMSASMGLKKEIPIDPKILSKVNEVKNDENEDGGEEFDEEDELDGIQFYNKEDERQVKDEQKQDDLTEPSQASAPVNNVASVAQDSIGEKSPPESVLPSADISPVSISSPPVQISSDQPLSVKEISLPTNVEHTASSDPASILPSQVKYEVVDGTTLYVDSGDVTEPPIHLPSYQTPPPLPATTTHTAHVITPTPPLTPSLSQDTITVPPTAGEEPSRSQVLNTPELMMVSTGLPQSTIDKGEAPAAAGTPPIQPQKDHVSREEPPEHLKAVPIGSGSMSVTSSATDESKPDAASIPSNQNIDENYKQITNEGGIDNFQPSIVGIQREQAPNSIGNFSSDSESAIPITNAAMTSDFTAPKPDDVLNIPADNKPNETNEPKATENVVEISGNNQDQTESLSPEASGLDGSPETSVPKVSARASALEGSAQASAFEGSTEASAFEGAPESFALEVSPESLVLEGSGNEQKQASHSIPDGYPETLATVSESEDLELEVEPQDSDVKAENGGSFFGAFFSGWSSTEEQKHEDEDEVSTDAPSNSGDESSDNLVNSGATVEENSQNSVQETSFITTMVKEPPSATITKSLEASAGIAGMPGLASNTLETKYGGDEAQEPAAHSGQDESSSAESGYSSDEEMNTSNPSTTHEPVAEGGTDSLSHDHQPGEGEADEPHSEDGNVESSLQPPTEASSETNPEYAHASLDGLQDEPNKSHISSDLEHAHSDESADTEAPEASDAKSPESPDLGSPESENESSVSSDANAEDPSDLHHPESLTGHLLKTVEPIIQWLSGSSQLGESLSLALEHDLSAPVESRGSLMAMAIVAATILLLYVVHAAFTRSARESPLLEALNRLEHEQHTADGLIMQLKSQLTSSQTAAASGVDEQQWAQASAQLREENEELKARCDELERQLEESTSSGLEMDNMIQDLLHAQKDTASFQEAIDSLQLMLDSQRDKVESLTSDLTIKTTLNDELRTESAAARDRIAKLEYQLEQVTRSLEEVSSAKSRVSAELYSEQTRLQELRTEHDTLTQSYSQATDALKAISEQQSSANLRAEQLDKLLKTREAELQVTKECLKQLKVFNDGRAGKDKLTQLLDVVKARSDLTCAQQERRALEAELKESSEQLQKLQERLQQAQQEAEQCRKEKMQAQLEQKEALNKLTVLTDYFQEEKAQLTKELESESGLRHTAEGSAESVSSRIRNYDMQLMAYKAQVEMLKKELEDQEVSYRTQLAAQEQKAHESWVAARAAERKYDESKQETAQLRSRLLLMSKENSEQLPIAKPLPKHAEASNGSLSSPRPPLHDDLDGEHSLPLDSPPPIPPPPHLLPHLFPPPPHLFPPPPHLPGMPPPPFLPPSHFLPPPPMLDRRLPPAGRLASPPFHRRIEAASPPFHRRIGAASPPELLDRHSPPIFDRRSFSPASERSRYSDRQYSPDRHSRYSPDKIGRYSPDRQGRYSPDRQDQFSPDRSGRYSPDRPGRYFPDRLYDRHHPDRYNNSDRHSDAYSSNGRNSSPDGVAKRTSPTPPQRRPYDNGGQLGKGKKTSTPLGPNDR
ncbi:transport and Golgi organization protein 1 isoform X5 [Hyalella azteca]|uniref:Transport and Golgi organization protein 1 isoform X5 n=1 Tax=Hyalella azteca TaxID=294128 RepID=A0A8B7N039_HYAAZ|nr:transport and Golgi organization protein 1 isoform X5 [Hyalella azteca]